MAAARSEARATRFETPAARQICVPRAPKKKIENRHRATAKTTSSPTLSIEATKYEQAEAAAEFFHRANRGPTRASPTARGGNNREKGKKHQ
jgi:hypothetical protein